MTATNPGDAPTLPMPRAEGCPFDPPPEGREAQRRAPVAQATLADGTPVWFVTRYQEARTLLADPRLSSDVTRPGYPHPAVAEQASDSGGPEAAPAPPGLSFILMDDPDHARLRRMVTAPFAVKRIEALRPRIQAIADDLIDRMLEGPQPVDFVEAFALPLPSLVICELLGVPYESHDFFQARSNAIIKRTATAQQRREATEDLAQYLGTLLRDKIASPSEDLASDIGRRVSEGDLQMDEAVQMAILLLIAGHETTANMIALGTLALLQKPDEAARLRDEPDARLVASAVEELLRYLTITHDGRKRVATADIDIAGVTIQRGDGVIVATDLANRDDAVFENPDILDLGRNPRNHVAFGFGVHQCLGQPLARVELQVVYPTVLRRLPTLALAASIDQVPFKHDGTVYGVYELAVAWTESV